VILFKPFGLLTPKTFKLFGFPTFSILIVLDEGKCRFNGRKYPFTTIKSPIDAMKFSNITQLSPK
jgi:hypothetical protein